MRTHADILLKEVHADTVDVKYSCPLIIFWREIKFFKERTVIPDIIEINYLN